MKSVLDYEVHYDQEKVSFLDCFIKIRDGQFQTKLYTKNADVHPYLLSSSCHPKHTINAIPEGQFIRIRRICTKLELYWKHAASYINFFAEQGYNTQKLQSLASDLVKMDREELLCYKPRETSKVSNIPKDLCTQWHPQISKLGLILSKHKEILTGLEMLSCCFPDPTKFMYREKRNLKDILCKSDISINSVPKIKQTILYSTWLQKTWHSILG